MIQLSVDQKSNRLYAERAIERAIREFEEATGLTAEKMSFSRDSDGGLEYVHLRIKGEK